MNASMHHPVVALGDLVEVRSSLVNPLLPDNSLKPHVGPEHIASGSGAIGWQNVKSCAEDGVTSGKYEFQSGDIIYSKIRPYLNKVAVADRTGLCSADMYAILVKPGVSRGFLHHYLQSRDFLSHAASFSGRANIPKLNREQLLSSPVPLPPLEDQKRIAAILDKADQLRQRRRQAIALLDSLAQSIFLEMFGDPIGNPHGFESVKLDDLVDQRRGISYGIVQRGAECPGGVPVLRIGDILDGEVRAEALVRTDPLIASKFQRTKLQGRELVISIRGTVGRCAVVPETLKDANVSREIAVIPSVEPERNDFLLTLLRTQTAQRRLSDDIKGVAQSGINLEDLRKLPVIRPPMHLVEIFMLVCSKLKMQHRRVRLSNELGEIAFASLHHRAFSGQL